MDDKIYSDASHVEAKEGAVVVDGPDGVDVKLTPEAASETSDRLLFAAGQAKSQQLVAGKRRAD
jgi:hypothetical protein